MVSRGSCARWPHCITSFMRQRGRLGYGSVSSCLELQAKKALIVFEASHSLKVTPATLCHPTRRQVPIQTLGTMHVCVTSHAISHAEQLSFEHSPGVSRRGRCLHQVHPILFDRVREPRLQHACARRCILTISSLASPSDFE